ncbi:MAG: 50S ribosomal protein L20, partial [Candidatus Omnitrophica bacterium CG1_02_49_10]
DVASRKRRKKVMKAARGGFGGRSRLYRTAKESVERGLRYSYVSRRLKKREFRSLWITRITAAARSLGINYSRLISGLKKAKISVNRKMLAELAVSDKKAFKALVDAAKGK